MQIVVRLKMESIYLEEWMDEHNILSYLVLLSNILLVVLLHLFEFSLQATQLHLHSMNILQIFLCPLIQSLNRLGHVLYLVEWWK